MPHQRINLGHIMAVILTVAGMIPFLVSAYLVFRYSDWLDAHMADGGFMGAQFAAKRLQAALMSLLVYGAVILSFLGGIRWGITLAAQPSSPRSFTLLMSIIAPLMAWIFVVWGTFVQTDAKLLWSYAILFVLYFLWDASSPEVPRWFKWVRVAGTVSAAGSFLATSLLFV